MSSASHASQLASNLPNDPASSAYVLMPAARNSGMIPLVIFGVLLPLASVGAEVLLRACSDTLFDPLPTIWHGLFAISVPIINAVVYAQTARGPARRRRLLGFLNAVAIGSGTYFAVAFLPALPLGLIGIAACGLGLLVLGPYFGLIAAIACRWRLRPPATLAGAQSASRQHLAFLLAGIALPLLVLAGGDVRRAFTLRHLETAGSSASPAAQAAAIDTLRRWGDEQAMLDACFGRGSRRSIAGGWKLFTAPAPMNVAAAAGAYYRVTGRAPEDQGTRSDWRPTGRQRFSGDWERWEEDQLRGGEAVGAPIAGLALNASALTGTIHADAATFYGEWVLEFRNDTFEPQEARCRVLLPEGGVVSRVTLWINGEEREAAYGSRQKVREAYQSVAVVQRRDPVLVTSCGRDRVMLQCFPVPAKGTMKTKIGVSAPLRLNGGADRGLVTLPNLLEQNFALPGEGRQPIHVVAVESGQPLEPATSAAMPLLRSVAGAAPDGSPRFELAGSLPDDLLAARVALSAKRRPNQSIAIGQDPFDAEKRLVVQTITPTTRPAAARLTIVVDGSAAMASHWNEICQAVAGIQPGVAVHGVIAADEVIEVAPGGAGGGGGGAALAAAMRAYTPVGGQDAVPALQRALDAAGPDGLVLWLHGPQPVLLTSTAPLEARLAARRGLRLVELPMGRGHNRVADALAQGGMIETAAFSGTAGATVRDVIAAETATGKGWRLDRELRTWAPEGPDIVKGNINLARLWAAEEVNRLIRTDTPTDRQTATTLAVGHQLVTAVSGAVVLETQEQYQQHNLNAAMAVPLPPAVWAALATIPLVLLARRRMMRSVAAAAG